MSLRAAAVLSGCVLAGAVRVAIVLAGTDGPPPQETPAGFNTPSFNGAQSVNNGNTESPGDTFALDQQIFELNHSVATGLGPVYNATACVSCHENPNTRDGIVQVGPQVAANKLRTVPLWGLRTKARFMHDLKSLSLDNAIQRHRGEASEVERRFDELSPNDRDALLTFLKSL